MASGASWDSPATTLRGRRAQNLELVVQIRGPEARIASAACAAPAPSRRAWAPLLSGSPRAHRQNVPRNSQGSRVWATQLTSAHSTWARRAQDAPARPTSALPPSPPRWGGATTTAPLFAGWRGRAPSSARGRYPGRGSGRPGGRAVGPPRGARRGAGCCAGWSSGLGARRSEDRRGSISGYKWRMPGGISWRGAPRGGSGSRNEVHLGEVWRQERGNQSRRRSTSVRELAEGRAGLGGLWCLEEDGRRGGFPWGHLGRRQAVPGTG